MAASQSLAAGGHIRLGFDTYSLRAYKWNALQFIEYAAAQKLDSIQLSSLNDFESLEPAYLAKVKEQAARAGIQLDGGIGCICPSARRARSWRSPTPSSRRRTSTKREAADPSRHPVPPLAATEEGRRRRRGGRQGGPSGRRRDSVACRPVLRERGTRERLLHYASAEGTSADFPPISVPASAPSGTRCPAARGRSCTSSGRSSTSSSARGTSRGSSVFRCVAGGVSFLMNGMYFTSLVWTLLK